MSSIIAALASQRSVVEADFRPELRSVDLPTLIIHGDGRRPTVPLERTGHPTAALIPSSRVVLIEGVGHGLYASAACCNGEFLEFIAACPSKHVGGHREPEVARQ